MYDHWREAYFYLSTGCDTDATISSNPFTVISTYDKNDFEPIFRYIPRDECHIIVTKIHAMAVKIIILAVSVGMRKTKLESSLKNCLFFARRSQFSILVSRIAY